MKKVFALKGNFQQRSNRLKKIKNSLSSFDQYVFDETHTFDYVLQQMSEYSCFSDNKLIILKGMPISDVTRATLLKRFADALLKSPSSCVVVLDNLDIRAKSFFDKIEPICERYNYIDKIETYNLKDWLPGYFKKRKELKNPGEDIEKIYYALMVNESTVSVDSVNALFNKLVCLTGNAEKIPTEVVDSVCADYDSFLINQFINVLDKCPHVKTISYAKAWYFINARMAEEPNLEEEVAKLVYLLANRYDLIQLIVNYLLEKNKCEKLDDRHIEYTPDIWDYIKKIEKLEREGSFTKTRMIDFEERNRREKEVKDKKKKKRKTKKKKAEDSTEEGKKKEMPTYFKSPQVVGMVKGFGSEPPSISFYRDRWSLYVVRSVINKTMCKLRSKHTRSELLILLAMMSKVICKREFTQAELDYFDMPYRFIKGVT
tara:strand:- start:8631 stop:9920 length:1290 start_codon:yes stop_codon:yes gene_type:complete